VIVLWRNDLVSPGKATVVETLPQKDDIRYGVIHS
jgi:hypothetical protein